MLQEIIVTGDDSSPPPFACPVARSCHCSVTFVRCTNAQLRHAGIFVDIAARFPRIREVSVSGNSLMGLRAPIFATPEQKPLRHLHRLLIPNNYLVELHPDVFLHAPNLHYLDLSFNEIKLDKSRPGFLKPLRRLRHLVMRKGFSRPLKYDLDATSRQLVLLEKEFTAGNLTELVDVDLSINFIRYIPVGFGCTLAGTLRKLILDGNEISTLSIANASCLFDLKLLSLQRNLFGRLSPDTRLALSAFDTGAVQTSVADWAEMRCGRSTPSLYAHSIAAIPTSRFVCSRGGQLGPGMTLLLLLIFLRL